MALPPDPADVTTAPDGLVRVLPEALANKIAAGEVVQRPASVLKELMENALDAGARQITVVLRQAGSELVQVVDDGCGMGPEDAAVCFGRHATSKIASADDLERIRTLGFRGEALASVAAVAQVELKSKRRSDAAGTCVRIAGSRIEDQSPCAVADGTSIAVRNLFFNVPARRNFLKSPATEFKHLVETFQFLALSNPTVGFALVHDDAEVYRLAPSAAGFEPALRARIADLLGDRAEGALVSVAETTSYLSVRGVVGRPEGARRSRGEQFFFVNGRFVKNRSLEHAVATAFGDLLPKGSHPLFTLFFSLDPRHLDVNVHPTKTEVKFDDERGVYGFIRAVVKKALGDADVTPSLGDGFAGRARSGSGLEASPLTVRPVRFDTPATLSRPSTIELPAVGLPTPVSFEAAPDELPDDAPRPVQAATIPSGAEPFAEDEEGALGLGERPPVWQLHNRYVVTPIRSGLLLVDQRAAHERILYEQALAALDGGMSLSQQLLFPVTIELPPADYQLVLELADDLRKLGFDLAPFAGRTVKVEGVPADVSRDSVQGLIEDVLDRFKSYRSDLALGARDSLAKSVARRRAIAPGAPLAEDEARTLIDELFACATPTTCPHGRPTMIKVSLDELERRFGR